MMETDEEVLNESAIESEDLLMSDEDATENEELKSVALLNIDYNSRLTSDSSLLNPSGGSDLENNSVFFCTNNDSYADATCEELEFSDEDFPPPKSLQKINLDDVSCFGVNKSANSDSTFHQSCTTFKEECQIDTEYLSEEESDSKAFSTSNSCRRRLSGGLSLVDSTSTMKDKLQQGSVSIGKSFSNSIFMKNVYLSSAAEEQSPLMTCLEFLKSENSDEELTDIEEYSVKSDDGNETVEVPVHNLSELSLNSRNHDRNALDNALRRSEMQHCGSPEDVQRKSSLIVELLSEDETTNLENEEENFLYKRNIKKLSNAHEYASDCPTDEESFDLDNKEWTETDESGCVRQVTVVKTETSINFEGEGEALDSDDLVSSTTTTTTTRVVTSVISDPDVQSEVESSFVQQLSGDDIRQSCEITFSDTVHDTSRPDE